MTLEEQMKKMETLFVSVIREEAEKSRKFIQNDILDFKDGIISEMKTIRLEQAVIGKYKKTLVDHEDRISDLEKKRA